MAYFAVKVLVSALLIAGISELSHRSSLAGALLASLPLTSLLAFIWIYLDSGDGARIAGMSVEIFWLVLPSLALFLALPLLLRNGVNFWLALPLSALASALLYLGALWALRRYGHAG